MPRNGAILLLLTLDLGRARMWKQNLEPKSKREEILDAAEKAILRKGVSGTTIDELIAEVDISKNGFFYHFRDKDQMVEAILDRNLEVDKEWFDRLLGKAARASNDPLARFLAFLELMAAEMESLEGGHPGCLTTACCYQERMLGNNVRQVAASVLLQWRSTLLGQLEEIAQEHPPKNEVTLQELADMLPALIDGAIIFARVVDDNLILPRQIRLYRDLIQNTFGASK